MDLFIVSRRCYQQLGHILLLELNIEVGRVRREKEKGGGKRMTQRKSGSKEGRRKRERT